MIAIYSGANKTITHSEVQAISSELSSSDVLLVQLENNLDATVALIQIAHELGKTVILNPAPCSDEIISCLPFVDVITPNETEASLLSGVEVRDIDTAKEAALIIAGMGVKKSSLRWDHAAHCYWITNNLAIFALSLPLPSIPPVPAMRLMARWQRHLPPETVWFRPRPGPLHLPLSPLSWRAHPICLTSNRQQHDSVLTTNSGRENENH
jgi:hypothetical protein